VVNTEPRAPVVTIMGHVDHGKTSLLDYIRRTNVAAGEAGGITQHIGAYSVLVGGRPITFLDTPGHEAFTSMRARGAQVTDLVVLVVAADDRIMPQTIEAIDHARAADVPILVAINKIDVPGARPDLVKQELTKYKLVTEEFGGDTIMCEVSAKKGIGIDHLLEMILLKAELMDLKSNPDRRAKGAVIESRVEPGRGIVVTVLVQSGTLHVGDPFVAGRHFGKVRALANDLGERVKEAGPSIPVEVTGFSGSPTAGDNFQVVEEERSARDIAGKRQQLQREQEFRSFRHMTLAELSQRVQQGEVGELRLIIKADVDGSAEALTDHLSKMGTEEVKLRIIHSGVGNVTESDVLLGVASDAVVIAFRVRVEPKARDVAAREKVDVRSYEIIYKAEEDIKLAMCGLLKREIKETVVGMAEIRNVFRLSKSGTVAGCFVSSGSITRNSRARLLRKGEKIFEGKIGTLKRFKDDVREVATGFECGITLDGYTDYQEGDQIQAYQVEEVARSLA
jgi:translation initiation factor IF-2